MAKPITNVVGIDDAPFDPSHRGDVLVVGAVCARTRLDGVISTRVRRDGANATRRIAEMIKPTKFGAHVRAVLLQGIAVAGFNVVDVHELAERLGVPVIAVVRRPPDLESVERALLSRVRGGARKWRIIERAGALERAGPLYIQRAGIGSLDAARLLAATTLHGNMPEPLRLAHIIAGGVTTGVSRGRA